jgi:predicted nucleic acid-binding protein
MLFIYLLEANPGFSAEASRIYSSLVANDDDVCTSILTVGEVMVMPVLLKSAQRQQIVKAFFASGTVRILPIDFEAMDRFARLRATTRIAPADVLHLACAAAFGVDYFLTNDKTLHKQQVDGIGRIVGLDFKF